MNQKRTNVPCRGCVACCVGDAISLHPELGDDPNDYETVPHFLSEEAAKGRRMLKHKEDLSCYYLGKNGCTIHDRAPALCRNFSCVGVVKKIGKAKAKQLASEGFFNHAVVARGIDLLKQQRGKK